MLGQVAERRGGDDERVLQSPGRIRRVAQHPMAVAVKGSRVLVVHQGHTRRVFRRDRLDNLPVVLDVFGRVLRRDGGVASWLGRRACWAARKPPPSTIGGRPPETGRKQWPGSIDGRPAKADRKHLPVGTVRWPILPFTHHDLVTRRFGRQRRRGLRPCSSRRLMADLHVKHGRIHVPLRVHLLLNAAVHASARSIRVSGSPGIANCETGWPRTGSSP